jgi:hypothetical protein
MASSPDEPDLTEEPGTASLEFFTQPELGVYIKNLESDRCEAAKKVHPEKAAKLRNTVKGLPTKDFLFS